MINNKIFDARTKIDVIKNICKIVFLASFTGMLIFIGLAWSSFNLAVRGYHVMSISYWATIIGIIHADICLISFLIFVLTINRTLETLKT